MQLDWLDLSPTALWTLAFLLVFFGLGTTALWRLRQKRRAQLRSYVDTDTDTDTDVDEALGEIEPHADPESVAPDADSTEAPAPAVLAPPEAAAPPAVALPTDVSAAQRAQDARALKAGLARTKDSFLGRISQIFSGKAQIDEGVLDALEEVLLTADVGVGMAMQLMDDLRAQHSRHELKDIDGVRALLQSRMQTALRLDDAGAAPGAPGGEDPFSKAGPSPKVILFVGVNGVGKTTSIGKIAAKLRGEGKSVLLAAGDTFRAAAAEQLTIWAERTGARIVRGDAGADPASVMFNAVEAARTGGVDVVLADTAGRLHTKTDLMQEIQKVRRACSKVRAGAPDETWLVVDGTTGQNALQQAKEFHQALTLTGVILTKLDGTAKGGVVVAIVDALKIPVVYVGVGEKAEDLMAFDADQFVEALFATAEAA